MNEDLVTQGLKRILIIDDEPEILHLLQMQLVRYQFQVDSAGSIPEACKKVSENSYDIVICDFRLPGGTGVDIFNQVDSETPFVLFSGYSDLDENELRRLGIRYLIQKPVHLDVLVRTIQDILAQ